MVNDFMDAKPQCRIHGPSIVVSVEGCEISGWRSPLAHAAGL